MKKNDINYSFNNSSAFAILQKDSKPAVTDNTDIDKGTIITVTAAQIAHRFTPGIYS